MADTAADVLIEGIIDWGVDTVFGIPGDGINGIMEALRPRKDRVRFIQARHEEAAALMACAYAKYTGRLGCCLATSGPGGIHLLNGLYDAKLDQAPVLAITGQTYSDLKGSKFQQEINMTLLFEDVTVYNQEVINPNQVEMLTNEACRHALNHRGVAHITFPVDYQEIEPTGHGSMHKVEGHTTSRWSPPHAVPPEDELRLAGFILNEAGYPRRSGRTRRGQRSNRDRRKARRADCQSPARQSGRSRRSSFDDGWSRTTRHYTFTGSDGAGRCFTYYRLVISVYGISAKARSSQGRAD
jgi:thiamine pyrophosphate-dependent acetolactate synthase large subunit-like protein